MASSVPHNDNKGNMLVSIPLKVWSQGKKLLDHAKHNRSTTDQVGASRFPSTITKPCVVTSLLAKVVSTATGQLNYNLRTYHTAIRKTPYRPERPSGHLLVALHKYPSVC